MADYYKIGTLGKVYPSSESDKRQESEPKQNEPLEQKPPTEKKRTYKRKQKRTAKKKSVISLPPEFMNIIDEILAKNPDFKNREHVVRHSVRKYYDELQELKFVE